MNRRAFLFGSAALLATTSLVPPAVAVKPQMTEAEFLSLIDTKWRAIEDELVRTMTEQLWNEGTAGGGELFGLSEWLDEPDEKLMVISETSWSALCKETGPSFYKWASL